MDRTRRRITASRAGGCLCVAGEGKTDWPPLSGNAGGIKERSTMAEIPRKDRAAIKSDIALSRDRMARELSGLRYELDFPRKLKNSFRDQTAIWIGALAAVGLLIVIAPARKKKIYIRTKDNSKGNGKGLLEAGALVGVLKFAATLLRPALIKFVTSKISGYPSTRSRVSGR